MANIDLSKMPVMWVITKNPSDFPKGDQGDLFVARRRWVGNGEQYVAAKETCATPDLEACRQYVIKEAQRVHKITSLVVSPRHPNDDPVIVETWL